MKIANETKIGVLAAVAIILLILGFNLLKGNSLFQHTSSSVIHHLYCTLAGWGDSRS